MTHGSLFSGIGGFDLGFERAGIETIWQVEIDPYATKVLEKHWPHVKRYTDVKEIHAAGCCILADSKHNGRSDATRQRKTSPMEQQSRWTEASQSSQQSSGSCSRCVLPVNIITGGFPCQPFSVAGKQRGTSDNRYLWPEMHRIIEEVRPRWIVAENVPGLITLALDQVLSDLEALGYTVGAVTVPACAVDAPHRRERLWIVANALSRGCEATGVRRGLEKIRREWTDQPMPIAESGADVADTRLLRPTKHEEQTTRVEQYRQSSRRWWAVEPKLRGVVDGVSERLDGAVDASYRVDSVGDPSPTPETFMRALWLHGAGRFAPQGRESDEQLTRELANALSRLPHQGALANREASLEAARQVRGMRQTCTQIGLLRNPQQSLSSAWQSASDEEKDWVILATCRGEFVSEWPGIPRVSKGVPARVDRLKCLGNAIVPQIAEAIGRMIVETEQLEVL